MTNRQLAIDAWESLFRAQHEIFTEISEDFTEAELSRSEYDVLLTVTRAPEQTARLREVTAKMLISQPSVSRLVDRMVERDLLTKCNDPLDGRGALVTATARGSRLFRALATRHARSIADAMSPLSDEDLRALLELTRRLRPGTVRY